MNDKQLAAICLGHERDNDPTCAEVLQRFYLDFHNDGLTTAQYAEHGELELNLVEHGLSLGRAIAHTLTGGAPDET